MFLAGPARVVAARAGHGIAWGCAASPISFANGGCGEQRVHDKSGIRLSIDAPGWRTTRPKSISPATPQPGQQNASHGRPARTAAPMLGVNNGSAPRCRRASHKSMSRAAVRLSARSTGARRKSQSAKSRTSASIRVLRSLGPPIRGQRRRRPRFRASAPCPALMAWTLSSEVPASFDAPTATSSPVIKTGSRRAAE